VLPTAPSHTARARCWLLSSSSSTCKVRATRHRAVGVWRNHRRGRASVTAMPHAHQRCRLAPILPRVGAHVVAVALDLAWVRPNRWRPLRTDAALCATCRSPAEPLPRRAACATGLQHATEEAQVGAHPAAVGQVAVARV